MAFFEPREQRMAVRVVYDGVARAGKTTNLTELAKVVIAQRSAEVTSPADLRGRTLFFDFMQVVSGVVCGFPLMCQVLSVPGQVTLTPRRERLLASADVVVYVCDSDPEGIAAARAGLELYRRLAAELGRDVPVVVQANKQDRPGALRGVDVLRALALDGAPAVEAIATDGVGVLDTLVTAVRSVSRALGARVDAGDLRMDVKHAETPAEILAALAREPIAPALLAEMLLEEAEAELAVARAADRLATDAADRSAFLSAARVAGLGDRAPLAARDVASAPGAVPLPTADVPAGFIWPAHTGRATLRALALGEDAAELDDDGVASVVSGRYVARTSRSARFEDAEAARQALVRAAREQTQLEDPRVAETVLVAQPSAEGAWWIWTLRPVAPAGGGAMDRAAEVVT